MARPGRACPRKARQGMTRFYSKQSTENNKPEMITATATLQGTSPYSQSKVITSVKGPKETHDGFETRTWRERLHTDENGNVIIPPTTFKNCLSEAAKYLTKQVPGQGKATYTKHFEAGVMCLDPVPLPFKAADVAGEKLHVPSDGKRGGTKRVWKTFPRIEAGWEAEVTFYVLDPLITEEVFREHLAEAGNYIGIGRFRPRNNGYYGRFIVKGLKWRNGE